MDEKLIENEEVLVIDTPERVQLEFVLASIGNRFLAAAIDHSIQYFSILMVVWIFLSIAGMESTFYAPEGVMADAPKWMIALMILILFGLFSGYFVLFEWLMDGQTPGKKLMKLRVIREDGRPITLWEALARNLLRIFDAAPGFLLPVYSAGLIAIFISPRDQRVGDVFASTVVIRERSDEAPTFAETFSNPLSDAAFRRVQKPSPMAADVSLLNDREVGVIESFLRRRWDLTDRQRAWMAWRIALPLMYKLKPEYDLPTFTYEGFLEEVLHRFHARRRFIN
jgi:uncharacterized RDD family membrane protein YckC